MKRHCLAALVMLLLPLAGLAEQKQPTYEMDILGDIEVNPDGAVRTYTLADSLAPAVGRIVDRSVRAWKFEPILVAGKPVIAKTRLHLLLLATPDGNGGYGLKVQEVSFGQPKPKNLPPPAYPVEAMYANLGAKVMLVLRLDPEGNVIDVFPEQTSLAARGNPRVTERWRKVFERESIAVARTWRFDMTETINGTKIESTIRVPVSFQMGSRVSTSWKAYMPGPIHPAPWLVAPSLAAADDRERLKEGEVQALTSRFHLLQPMVGTML